MEDAGAGAWAPIKQAAQVLGVSTDTVRRRMQRGELASRREDTPQGYRWLVRVDAPPSAPGSPQTREMPAHGSTVALIDDSRDELIAMLRDELTSRVREVAELHSVIIAQAKALESRSTAIPPELAVTREDALGATKHVSLKDAPAEPSKTGFAAWWSRIFGR